MAHLLEYIWIDGTKPTAQLRSKTRSVENLDFIEKGNMPPDWGADGSSTGQAEGSDSDIILNPVAWTPDPFRGESDYLVLCEVLVGETGEPHRSNHRADLRAALDRSVEQDPMLGFEQEYTMMTESGIPLGFPDGGFPGPQGPYYCGVGAGKIVGREVYEGFMQAVLTAGLKLTGFNWEVMPGQAEFQIAAPALEACDHIWIARWILHRVAEEANVGISLASKPAKGDWNGAGMHSNFSTKEMREPHHGGNSKEAIMAGVRALSNKVNEHLAVYGHDYESRLTGAHETARYDKFEWGVADRTASIRIPRHVDAQGYGYFEDRRPNANADPYQVADRIIRTVCLGE